MTKIRDYSKLAKDILSEIGGEENLVSYARCATRLRLVLKEIPEAAIDNIKQLPGVITVVISGGQFQIVIGTHVADVYEALASHIDPTKIQAGSEKKRIIDSIISAMSSVFAPIIYILASAGILQGILITVKYFAPEFQSTGAFSILNFISWTPFAFLPAFIAITASKYYKCNMFIALLCCCALINPDWAAIAAQIEKGELITFMYLPLAKTVYTSSVLPPLFLVWGLSYLEKFVEKTLPQVISALFTPLICVVIMVPLTLVLIGPVTSSVANGIAIGYNWMFETAPALAAAVIGGLWQVVVIFGVHWGITPVNIANFEMHGRDSFQAYQTIAVVAQMAAAFACAIKSKRKEFKTIAYSAGFTGIFGITEPAIYGVTLKLKKPFVYGCIGGAIGAAVASFFGSYYYAYAGLPGLLTIVNAISADHPWSFIGELTGVLVAIAVTFLLVFFAGFKEPEEKEKPQKTIETSTKETVKIPPIAPKKMLTLASPIAGKIIPLAEVNDESFSGGLLGDGIAFVPSTGMVVCPCDAQVVTTLDSHHAIGLLCDNGAELLIHVGLDTMKLKGQYFTTEVKQGDIVKAGTPLISFDKEKILAAGYDLTTPFIVINGDEFTLSKLKEQGTVDQGTPVITLA